MNKNNINKLCVCANILAKKKKQLRVNLRQVC